MNDDKPGRNRGAHVFGYGLALSSVLSGIGILFLLESDAIDRTQAYIFAIIPAMLVVMSFFRFRRTTSGQSRASHRYLWRLGVCMIFYLATLFAAEIMIDDRGLAGAPAAILAFLPGLAFAGVFWVFGRLIVEEKDEFFRMLYVRQGLIGTGIAMTAAAVWGFLETYEIVDHVAAFWWPTLWCFGIGVGAVANKLKYGTWGEMR